MLDLTPLYLLPPLVGPGSGERAERGKAADNRKGRQLTDSEDPEEVEPMRNRNLLAACMLACLGAVALAQDKPADTGDPRLPFNPFADAKGGDWATYALVGDVHGGDFITVTFRVKEVTDEQIMLVKEGRSGGAHRPDTDTFTVSRKGLPTLPEVFGEKPTHGWASVRTTEEEHKVGAKEFACTKITGAQKDVDGKEGDSLTYWLSKDVKCQGLVEMRVVEAGSKQETTIRLVGYGNGDKAEWGLLPKDNLADEGERRLPINPFAKAAQGDWAAFAVTAVNDKGEKSNGAETWRVTSVSDDVVKVTARLRLAVEAGEHVDEETFSSKEAPTLAAMVHGAMDHLQITSVKTTQEERKVGDREFDCWRVTFDFHSDKFPGAYEGTLWVSEEVKGAGIVEMRWTSTVKDGPNLEWKLTGFGSTGKADWGSPPEKK